jgi:hypothetical protein
VTDDGTDQPLPPPSPGGPGQPRPSAPNVPPPSADAPGAGTPAPGAVPPAAWVPPGSSWDSAASRPGDPTVTVVHDEGPPPPPAARARRRNRRLLVAVVVLLVVGVPVGLAIASALGERGTEVAAPDDGDASGGDASDGGADDPDTDGDGQDGDGQGEDDGTDGDGTDGDGTGSSGGAVDPETELEAPDVAALDGLDATFAQLLVDIDASEMTMIGFQSDLGGVFASADGERALAAARVVAEQRREELLEVRSRLEASSDEDDVEAVRDVYVEHLDSWERFMGAVEDDPTVLAMDGRDAIYTLDINATADAFSRELQSRLPAEVDDEVRAYADAILDRGFRSAADADV